MPSLRLWLELLGQLKALGFPLSLRSPVFIAPTTDICNVIRIQTSFVWAPHRCKDSLARGEVADMSSKPSCLVHRQDCCSHLVIQIEPLAVTKFFMMLKTDAFNPDIVPLSPGFVRHDPRLSERFAFMLSVNGARGPYRLAATIQERVLAATHFCRLHTLWRLQTKIGITRVY